MVLLTPGPTPVPASVLSAIAQPVAPHRTPEFEALYAKCAAGLQHVFNTREPVLTIAGSGSAAVEAALWSLSRPDGVIVACASGKFGERWQEVADRVGAATGCRTQHVTAPWGQPIAPDALADVLQNTPRVSAVVFVHCETSTATVSDAQSLAAVVRRHAPDALIIADGITTVGAIEVAPDDWGLDAVISASQKAIGLPPGLSFVSLSQRAAAQLKNPSGARPLYLDLSEYLRAHEKNTTPFTPAISLHFGLIESLRLIQEEGVEARQRRCSRFAHAARSAFTAMGLILPSAAPSDSVTAVQLPDDLADSVRKWCNRERGVIFAGGQDPWKGRVIRMSHMGFIGIEETIAGIEAIAAGLNELAPQRFDTVAGIDAAHAVLAKESAA